MMHMMNESCGPLMIALMEWVGCSDSGSWEA